MSSERFPFGWRYNGPRDAYEHYSGMEISSFEIERMHSEIDKRRKEWLAGERQREIVAVKNFERLSLMYFGVKPSPIHTKGERVSCKHGDKSCGVYWTCCPCEREEHERAWARLTPAQREYDRMVTSPRYGLRDEDRAPEGCSCHINPPCSYCTREVDQETA